MYFRDLKPSDYTDINLKRQISRLSILGNAALDEDKLTRVRYVFLQNNQIYSHIFYIILKENVYEFFVIFYIYKRKIHCLFTICKEKNFAYHVKQVFSLKMVKLVNKIFSCVSLQVTLLKSAININYTKCKFYA